MRYLILLSVLSLAGCDTVRDTAGKVGDSVTDLFRRDPPPATASQAPTDQTGTDSAAEAPVGPPLTAIPNPGVQALAAPSRTIAGLGDPAKPGLWLETPLVTAEQPGRVTYGATGASVNVTLKPIPGEATAGSRLSLQAMRDLGAPLTELIEVTAYPAS